MKKKIMSDIILNLIASFFPIFTLQFFILPQIASQINSDVYGQLLSLVAVLNLFGSSFGVALNNSRLIKSNHNNMEFTDEYYSIIYAIFSFLSCIVMLIFFKIYGNGMRFTSLILLLLTSILIIYKYYAGVEFRIKLNYVKTLIVGILLLAGYLLGFILFRLTNEWAYIYFVGYLLASLYLFKNTRIINFKIKKLNLRKDRNFNFVLNHTLILLSSGLLISVVTYIDKLIIFPILGGEAVSIYYVSTLLGKTLVLVTGPIGSVMLSYFAKMKVLSNKKFNFLILISLLLGCIGYLFIFLISKPLLNVLYPQYVFESMNYVPINTISILIIIICDIINVVFLRFRKVKVQVYINLVYVLLYLLISIPLLVKYGLMGFSAGVLSASLFKLIFMIVIYYRTPKTN